MKIAFLIIASEVLDGKISDQNTKLLAEFLRTQHLDIQKSLVVRDQKEAITSALKDLCGHYDLVVTSGGLGPTKDDITKETLGAFFQRELRYSAEAHKIADENYQRFNRPFPGKDHGYCYLPEGFIPLSNSTGFAPGFYDKYDGNILFSAPGVPREFKSMLQDHLLGLIKLQKGKNVFLDHVIVRTKNVPEEKIFAEVDPTLWSKLEVYGEVSSLPILMGVDIGVKVKAGSLDELSEKVSAIKKIFFESEVRKHIWHYGPESIEEKIVTLANQKKIRFGFAESATGGFCSHRITNISGSSQCFMGSVVCYDEKVKEHVLGVNAETLRNFGAVSLECAKEMAQGLYTNLNLDIAISITGYAGPGGGDEKFPVGSVCIGKGLSSGATSTSYMALRGDREILKQRFSQAALYALLEELENFA